MEEFEVIGDDEYDDDFGYGYGGPLEGDVMGDDDYEVLGDEGAIVGVRKAHRRRHGRRGRGHRILVRRPHWREGQLAPGVQTPDQGLLPLPMTPLQNGGVFTATQTSITFKGQVQKPFRGERLIIRNIPTGTTAIGQLQGLLFAGTDLMQLDVDNVNYEQIGQTNAFGVRLTMKPVQPGVFMSLLGTLDSNPTGTDTNKVTVTILGRNVH